MSENGKENGNGKKPSSALAIRGGAKAQGIVPQTFDECYRMAKLLAMSEMVPDTFRGKPDDCCVAIMQGLECGLSPIAALQSIAVINGRPSIWGDGALAIVRASGLLEEFEEIDEPSVNGGRATCTVKRRGEKPLSRSFSMADAKTAGLFTKKGPWQDYPARMRQMRARSWAIRDGFADVLKGLHIAEEVQDIPIMRDITPGQALAVSGIIEDIPDIDAAIDAQMAEAVATLNGKPDKKPDKAVVTDDVFLDQLDGDYGQARNLDALNEIMLVNEITVEERGLEQAAANLYTAHQKRIYQMGPR